MTMTMTVTVIMKMTVTMNDNNCKEESRKSIAMKRQERSTCPSYTCSIFTLYL